MAKHYHHLRNGQSVQDKSREIGLRRAFQRLGYSVERDCTRYPHVLRQRGYAVRSAHGNLVYGECYELTLDDLSAFLAVLRMLGVVRNPKALLTRRKVNMLLSRAQE